MTITIDGVMGNIEVEYDLKIGSWGFMVEIPRVSLERRGVSGTYSKRTGLASEQDAANHARQTFESLVKQQTGSGRIRPG